jgi:hypothetical protein
MTNLYITCFENKKGGFPCKNQPAFINSAFDPQKAFMSS